MIVASFGTFWAIEGVGIFRTGQESVAWPGNDIAILVLIAGWFLLSRIFIAVLGATKAPPGGRVCGPPVGELV